MAQIPFALSQEYLQGWSLFHQAMGLESGGNLIGAMQCYKQAISLLADSLMRAQQFGVPLSDQNFFALSCCHFNAARPHAQMGNLPMAGSHLTQALQAINQALMMNPGVSHYHSAAGTVLAALGNVSEAERAFLQALQLNPMDGFSQWMLAFLHSSQGNAVAANQYYSAACRATPALSGIQEMNLQAIPRSSPGEHRDWVGLISNAFTLANNVFGWLNKNQPSGESASFDY